MSHTRVIATKTVAVHMYLQVPTLILLNSIFERWNSTEKSRMTPRRNDCSRKVR